MAHMKLWGHKTDDKYRGYIYIIIYIYSSEHALDFLVHETLL